MKNALIAIFLLPGITEAREFPIGLYGISSTKVLAEIAEAGFTHIIPASKLHADQVSLAKASRQVGLHLVGFPEPLPISLSNGFPVSAWYLSDEPDVNQESPEEIRRQAARVRDWDPRTPLVLVVGAGSRAAEYADSVDAVMVDWYPVPHLPLASVGAEIATAVSQVPNKPIWAVLQSMDWRDYPQRDPKVPRIGRFPTQRELRLMAYHSIVRGAAGVFFFEFRKRGIDGVCLLDIPEQWQALRTVARELRIMKPFFEASPGTNLRLDGLEGKSWRRHGRTLVLLVNPTQSALRIPDSLRMGGYSTLFIGALHAEEVLTGSSMAPYSSLALIQ